jgi:UDP-hydrolysing UDP-N-acetyl-D-glucosamine 2-epimerase
MTLSPRKICIVTGTRSEYGLLYWLIKEVSEDPGLQLQLIATAMHLSPEFGLTYKIIEQDGFKIDEKVKMLTGSDSPVDITKSIGQGTIGFADALDQLKPDLMVVIGDRYEMLSAVTAATITRIPVAHLHGGESAEALIDEPIRHAITKMSHLHFTAAEPYRKKVIQMGEHPDTVFNVGAPGLDHVSQTRLMNRSKLTSSVHLPADKPFFLITYHPITLESQTGGTHMTKLFAVLDKFPDHAILFTKPNADTEGRIISQLIDTYAAANPSRVVAHTTLGQARYLSAIKHSDAVIGNSSSGLIEAPAFHKPTINIGDRQRGRLFADSVISCTNESKEITKAIQKALSEDFQSTLEAVINPYGMGGASHKIKEVIKKHPLDPGMLKKKFYILPQT